MSFKVEAEIANFEGTLVKLSHDSAATATPMAVNVYLPKGYTPGAKLPVLFYLSGLTCSPANCSEKGFFQPHADRLGFAIVYPDTSPRGANIAGEDELWDFGTGAGFYVDATTEAYKPHYQMYTYITEELPALLAKQFSGLDLDTVLITGHSMGGYGALMMFLRNPGKYKLVLAFAPILNPLECPWGDKCFTGYLGSDKSSWLAYDPCELVKKYAGPTPNILIHQGKGDVFYYRDNQLRPEAFVAASELSAFKDKVELHLVDKFDHSYFFISLFAQAHAEHHAKYLLGKL